MRRKTVLSATVFLVLAATRAGAADLIFDADFEPLPACTGQGLAATVQPASRQNLLGTRTRYILRVRSCAYAGALSLGASGAPASWSVSFDPPSPPIDTATVAVADMLVDVPTDGDAGLHSIAAVAIGGAQSATATAALDALDQVLITIAPGTGAGDHHFPAHTELRVGTMLRFVNADTVVHRIHMNGTIPGFAHEASDLLPGGEYDVTSSGPGTDSQVYCHDHGTGYGVVSITTHY